MTDIFKQPSFGKGELSPDLQGRVDMALYESALYLQRNWINMRSGGVQTRPGTKFLGRVKTSSAGKIRLIPFIFSQSVTFMLEFGNLYVRFYKAGAQVTEAGVSITAISQAASCQITAANSYAAGDELILSGIVGMTQLNGRNVLVSATGLTGAHFQITDLDGNPINSTGFTAYTSGGTAARIYQLTTPYVTADLQTLNYVQSANVLTVVHNNYPPADITRVSDNSWTYTPIVFQPGINGPSGITFSSASGNANTMTYQVTAIASASQEESLPGLGASQAVGAYSLTASGSVVNLTVTGHGLVTGNAIYLTATAPYKTVTNIQCSGSGSLITFTITGHGLTSADSLYFFNVNSVFSSLFTTDPTGQNFVITVVDANTFTLAGVTGTSNFNVSSLHVATMTQPYLATYGSQTWVVTKVDANNFTLNGANTALTLVVSSNTNASINPNAVTHALSGTPSSSAPNVLTWSAVPGAVQYNVYSLVNGLFCFIGATAALTFSDIGITANALFNPPIANNPFNSPGNYPSVVCYYQSRQCFANTINQVAAFWGSKPGCRTNFTTHIPTQTGDGAYFTITGNNEVNPIVGMLDCRYLLLFTSGGTWSVFGNPSTGLLDPTTSPGVVQNGVFGSSTLRPLLVNTEALYVQAQGGVIRNLEYQFARNNFEGQELSISANHLIENYTILDWAYQKVPSHIIWMVRSDGVLLAITYVKDQQMEAWSHHDFIGQVTPTNGTLAAIPITQFGTVENIAVVPEGQETVLYLVVNRALYGSNIRYIERLSTRLIPDITNISTYNQMDAALSFDGTGSTSVTMSLGAGSYTDHLTLTASSATFSSANVGDAYFLYTVPVVPLQPVSEIRFVVDTFLSSMQVQGHIQGAPLASNLSTTTWARAVNKLSGLWHLQSQAVSVFGDGYVVGNPFNNFYATLYQVDAFGNLTLDSDKWYSKITVGLPITCDIQTLRITSSGKDGAIYERIIVNEIQMMLREARGVFGGQKQPDADVYGSVDTTQTNLERLNPRLVDDGYNVPPQLKQVNNEWLPIPGQWDTNGQALIRVTDPLPVTLLQIAAKGTLPPRNPTRQ